MTGSNKIAGKLEALGHYIFYAVLSCFGQTGAYLLLTPVIFIYVLFSRKIHEKTAYYIYHRFPGESRAGRWLATYRLVHSFGKVLVDRAWLGIKKNVALKGKFSGQSKLMEVIKEGKGVILVTAHVGNWQTALAHLTGLPVTVHSLMHYDQGAAAKHYFDLNKSKPPFRIIPSDGFLGGMIEATAALQRGEIVTIMGDRYAGGPGVTTEFMGSEVKLPATPYMLAASTSAPVVVLLAAKTGRKSYRIKVWDVFRPELSDRNDRDRALKKWGRRFALSLEKYLTRYPYQWYNFYDFRRQ